MKKYLYSLVPVLFCIVVSLPVILPYFHKGYFPTHDGEWAVVRLADMFRELRDHQIPPRFSGNLNFGYGYPLFNFTYPLPYYFSVLFHFLKIGFVDSMKITFALTVPISAIGMYIFSQRLWNSKIAGVVSSILYIYFPYRMVDLYVRGSIGESVAFAIAPFVFLGLICIFNTKNNRIWVGYTAILYALLILAHNIMAVEFSIPIALFSFYIGYQKNEKILSLVASLILGILLSSFFSIPAFFEKNLISLSVTPIADRTLYFVRLPQLLFSSWGYGTPTDIMHPFSYQLGIIHILVFIGAIIICVSQFRQKIDKKYIQFAILLCMIIVSLLFLLFSQSAAIWKLPLLKEINYPWTLLGPIGFLLSLTAGFIVIQLKNFRWAFFAIVIVSIAIILPNAHPQSYIDRGDNFYVTNDATTTSSQELMPLWVKRIPFERPADKVRIMDQGYISGLLYNSKSIYFVSHTKTSSLIRINTLYYPGWAAFIDTHTARISYKNNGGVMDIFVPQGDHSISLRFTETPIRIISDMISVITAIGIVGFYCMGILQANKKKT